MWNSIRLRVTLTFIGLAVGPLLLVGFVLAQRSFAVEQAQALDLQRQVVQRVSAEIEAFFQERESELNLLGSEFRRVEAPDRAQQISILLSTFNAGAFPDIYEEFTLLDDRGQEQFRIARLDIVSTDALENRAGADEFERPKASGDIYFSPVWFDDDEGSPFVTIALPLLELRSVQLKNVLVADLRLEAIGGLLAGLSVGDEQTIYVVDTAGRVVAHQDRTVEMENRQFEAPDQTGVQTGLSGNEVVLATETVQFGDQSFTVIAERTTADALAPATNTLFTIAFTTIAALVVATALGIFLVGKIVHPIENLATVAQAISDGHLSQRAEVTGRDELGKLAHSFNSMAGQLQETIGGLDQQIADRTRRLELVAAIGEYLNAILDIESLLPEIVNQVKDNFAYYHVHIYLLDEYQEKLEVAAGTGPAGAEMKAKGHSIALNAASLVARAARSGEIVKVDNVRQAEDWLPNPLLPDTYSEMAVPIILEGQVVGVLDVQEDEIAGLDDSDATLLRSLASQVAVAIRNARLFEEVQTNLTTAQALQQRYVEQAWDKEKVIRQGATRVQFSLGESSTLDEATIAEARHSALSRNKPHVATLNGQAGQQDQSTADEVVQAEEMSAANGPVRQPVRQKEGQKALVAPIMQQGIPIGNLQLHHDQPDRQWSESEMALIQAVINQVAQIAENLRLVDSIQERASREQLIGQISAKLRRATDMESLLEIGAGELARVLKPDRTFIRLGSKAELTGERLTETGDKSGSNSDTKGEAGSENGQRVDPVNGVENE